MPCEVGAAALYKCLDETCAVVQMKIPDARSFESTLKEINKIASAPKKIIVIGTYWTCLTQLLEALPSTQFVLYCFGKSVEDKSPNLTLFSGENGVGPAQFLFNLAKEKSTSQTLIKLFEKNFSQVITLIDDRIYNRNITESQPFYTGLFNYGEMDLPLFDKFVKLFQGDYQLDDVIKSGKTIVSAQMQMAKERVVNNSKTTKLSNGMTAVMTEAPELVNLTHDALHQKHPEAQLTMILSIKFGTQHDELAYSFRSFDQGLDASDLAKKVNGDGNNSAAGGRLRFDIPLPF